MPHKNIQVDRPETRAIFQEDLADLDIVSDVLSFRRRKSEAKNSRDENRLAK